MTNFLGIPNFLIKIGVNNLQNKMNIKKNKKKCFKGVFFPLIKFGNLNQNIH